MNEWMPEWYTPALTWRTDSIVAGLSDPPTKRWPVHCTCVFDLEVCMSDEIQSGLIQDVQELGAGVLFGPGTGDSDKSDRIGTGDSDKSDSTGDSDKSDGTGDSDGTDGTGDSDGTDGTGDSDETDGTGDSDGTDGTGDSDGTDKA
jgi:hypothetical protein